MAVRGEHDAARLDAIAQCFTTAAVKAFRTACHLALGDRDRAERLLGDACIAMLEDLAIDLVDDSADGRSLTFMMHRLQWAASADARVMVSLVDIEHVSVDDAAATLGVQVDVVEAALGEARGRFGGADEVEDAFRGYELWFDDDARAAVLARIRAVGVVDGASVSEPERRSRAVARGARTASSASRQRWWQLVALAAVVAVGAVVWQITATGPAAPSPAPSTAPSPDAASAGSSARTATTDLAALDLASGLSNIQRTRPDTIVRFSDDTVGLAWTGDCNRPAVRVQFANSARAVILRLETGAFPVVSCVGMPTRWTAVVPIPSGIDAGRIVPNMTDSGLSVTFNGYSEMAAASTETTLHENGSAAYGSALLDGEGHAWAFVQDCSAIDRIRYPLMPDSPTGAPFYEVRLRQPNTPCPSVDRTPRLIGPSGHAFPYMPHRDGGSTGVPADCHGPSGSATDIASVPAVPTKLLVTTWDGCYVRPGVAATTLAAQCGWDAARTISFGDLIGRPIDASAGSNTFIGDEAGVVPGQVAPLLPAVGMPPDSSDTGIRLGPDQLWIAPSVPDALYVVTDHGVQRWPRYAPPGPCAGSG